MRSMPRGSARGTHIWMLTNNAEIAAPHASRHATAAAVPARGTSQPNPISAAHMNASAATITVLKCRSMASPVSTLPSRPAAPNPNSSSATAAGATPGICRRYGSMNVNAPKWAATVKIATA
ncbi:hypothetical protein WJ70_15760 [Burkholderia ubonensis]|nr:hypothetical protein WJ70_15760 [Burkholderia ubonensis]